jgi:death on curing protein
MTAGAPTTTANGCVLITILGFETWCVVQIPLLYPSYKAVIRLHEAIIRKTGGELGFVSRSNLAYILDTVRDIGEDLPAEEGIVRKSGYLLFDLVDLHPFLDGNKRTAFEVTKNFLRLNGRSFEPEEDDAFGTLVSISKGELDAESAENWITRNLSRVGERR